MSHFTSEQLPIGSPAIVEEPHAPAKAEAGEVVVDPVEEDAPVEVLPAVSEVPDGDVGPVSVFSNAQPVASVDASSRLRRVKVFMRGPYSFVSAHTVLVCTAGSLVQNSKGIEDST